MQGNLLTWKLPIYRTWRDDWIGFIPFQNMRQSTRTIQSVETFHGLEGKDENNIKKKVLIYVSFFNTYKEIKIKMSPQAK
jgi:hypothetical protein